jgi:hypothetical protein
MVFINKRVTQYIVLEMLLCAAFLPAANAGSSGTSIFPFLKICPSVPNAAMGEITAAVNAQSVLMNPAFSPWIKEGQIIVENMLYIGDSNYGLFGYHHPVNRYIAFDITAGMLGAGGFTRTVADAASLSGYAEQGSFSFSDAFLKFGFGHRTSRFFSYGVSLQAARESIDTQAATGVMASIGGFYNNYMRDDWCASFGVFNIGPPVKGYDLPMGGYLGFGKAVSPGLFWGGDIVGYLDQTSVLRTGFEYSLGNRVFLRAGYRYSMNEHLLGDFPSVDLTAGLGLNFSNFSLDYAWLPYGDLGDSHRLAITYSFGKN